VTPTLVAAAFVVAVGVAALGPHVLNGGFHADDWVDAGRYYVHPGTGFWAAVRNDQVPARDAKSVVDALRFATFGLHPSGHLAFAAAVAIIESCLLLVLARRLGVGAAPAAAMAVLLLLLPDADSTRLWSTGVQIALFAGLLPIAGALLALRGLESRGLRGVALHAAALGCYALSVNGYELAAPVIALAGLLYLRRAPARDVAWRWACDVAVVVGLLIAYARRRHLRTQPIDAVLRHLGVIGQDGLGVIARALVPVGSAPQAVVLSGAGAAIIVAAAFASTPRAPAALRVDLRHALVLVGAGVAVTAAGWLMIVPADLGYDPGSSGVGNRINGVAAVGLALTVVGMAALVASAVRAAQRGGAVSLGALTALLVVPVAAGDAAAFHRDVQSWDHAGAESRALLARVLELVPAPAPGTTVFTFGIPGYAAPSVPIFGGGGNNDLLGAIHAVNGTDTVAAFPVLSGMRFDCNATTMRLRDTGARSTTPYGLAVLVDIPTGRVALPRDRDACIEMTAALQPYAPVNETE
jgi:hypothetical protein